MKDKLNYVHKNNVHNENRIKCNLQGSLMKRECHVKFAQRHMEELWIVDDKLTCSRIFVRDWQYGMVGSAYFIHLNIFIL